MMISSAPATATTAVARPKANCLIRTGFAPIRRNPSSSCATARIALPMKVFDRYAASEIVNSNATANATSCRIGIRMSPIRQALPI